MNTKTHSTIDPRAYLFQATTVAAFVGAAMLVAALDQPVRSGLGLDTHVATLIGAAGALVLFITAGANVIIWLSREGRRPMKVSRQIAVIDEADVPAYKDRLRKHLAGLSEKRLAALYVLGGGSDEDLAEVPADGRADAVYQRLIAQAGTGLRMREQLQSLVTFFEGAK